MSAATYRFTVGRFECLAVHDGDYVYTADLFVANAPPGEVTAALRAHGLRPECIPSPYSGLVVNTGRQLVLIDTGAGDLSADVGKLLGNLRGQGIAPEDIDTVILTHAHPDHIGGNTDDAGRVVFRNARHVMWRVEWDYWTDEATLARLPAIFGRFVRKNLPPLRGQLDLLDREGEIAPGIRAIAAPGHTPGHLAIALSSGGDELLYVSDAAIHPIHLEHPGWYPGYDVDPAEALRSKRRLFARAAAERSLVLAFHFDPFPSLGHVIEQGAGWQWQAVAAGSRTPSAT